MFIVTINTVDGKEYTGKIRDSFLSEFVELARLYKEVKCITIYDEDMVYLNRIAKNGLYSLNKE